MKHIPAILRADLPTSIGIYAAGQPVDFIGAPSKDKAIVCHLDLFGKCHSVVVPRHILSFKNRGPSE